MINDAHEFIQQKGSFVTPPVLTALDLFRLSDHTYECSSCYEIIYGCKPEPYPEARN